MTNNLNDLKKQVPENRLIGEMPRVGIRPIIDGRRRGVRESLEDQTMHMAHRVADFISANLRHPNGLPVECVVPDFCISRAAESAQAAGLFAKENVGVSLSVTPCWAYGSETMDRDPLTPKAIWGFNGTERPGAVYLAATVAAHNQKGIPVFSIYGRDVQDVEGSSIPEDVQGKILQFIKAGLAAAYMRGKSYLAMGGVSMGIAGSMVDQNFFEDYLGMSVESIDMSEFARRISEGIFDPVEFEKAKAWVKEHCQEGEDSNPLEIQRSRSQKDKDWDDVIKMALISRDLLIGNPRLAEMGFEEEALGFNALASGFQGQRQWTDHFPNGDFMEAILNSSFDWNGIREAFVFATENDSLNAAAMLFGHLLTNTAQIFADVRTYWSPRAVKRVAGHELSGRASGGIIHLINSGSCTLDATGCFKEEGQPLMKPFWDITPQEVKDSLDATRWYPANLGYFRGGGYSSGFLTDAEMPVTMSRINLIKGLGPTLQIAEGYTVRLPAAVDKILEERTDPTWPTTWFAPNLTGKGPFKDVYSVMYNWGANHGAISYGHIGADLITLAAMLRIPVALHNVSEERIFRPAVWGAFGALEPQAADYQACQTLGALYKR